MKVSSVLLLCVLAVVFTTVLSKECRNGFKKHLCKANCNGVCKHVAGRDHCDCTVKSGRSLPVDHEVERKSYDLEKSLPVDYEVARSFSEMLNKIFEQEMKNRKKQ